MYPRYPRRRRHWPVSMRASSKMRFMASCATMSSHTCYRTSTSFHFPFGAVCSFSGAQPEFSVGRLHPLAHLKGHPLVICCFLSIQRPSGVNEGEATPGPTWPGPLGPQRPKGHSACRRCIPRSARHGWVLLILWCPFLPQRGIPGATTSCKRDHRDRQFQYLWHVDPHARHRYRHTCKLHSGRRYGGRCCCRPAPSPEM